MTTTIKNLAIYNVNNNALKNILPYLDLFISVCTLTDKQAEKLSNDLKHDQFFIDHEQTIWRIKDAIFSGYVKSGEIAWDLNGCDEVSDGVSDSTIYRILDELEGTHWRVTRDTTNSKIYSLT